jgi:hypothetical protein
MSKVSAVGANPNAVHLSRSSRTPSCPEAQSGCKDKGDQRAHHRPIGSEPPPNERFREIALFQRPKIETHEEWSVHWGMAETRHRFKHSTSGLNVR